MRVKLLNNILYFKHYKVNSNVVGVKSTCPDGHVLFLDLDNTDDPIGACKNIQRDYQLGSFIIF